MTLAYSLPLAAFVISLGGFLYTIITGRRRDALDLSIQLYARIDDLEGQIETVNKLADKCAAQCKELEAKIEHLEAENFKLLRRLLRVDNG